MVAAEAVDAPPGCSDAVAVTGRAPAAMAEPLDTEITDEDFAATDPVQVNAAEPVGCAMYAEHDQPSPLASR